MFFCASFPYTYTFTDDKDKYDSKTAAAWMYIFGSVLFLLCGILDIRRFHYLRDSDFFDVVEDEDDDERLGFNNTNTNTNTNNNRRNRNRNNDRGSSSATTAEPSSKSSLSEIIPKQIVNKTEQASA